LEFVRQNLYLIIPAIASGAAFLFFTFYRPGKKNSLTPTQATLLINRESAQVIDLRKAPEYVDGHVPESRNIPPDLFDARIDDLEKSKDLPLILVCKRGSDSARACARLAAKGFSKVHYVEGGIDAWCEEGLLLKKGSKK
jgi:rhodanese-related sulfurtransferase